MAITWKDKKPVHLISTVPVGNTMETAKQKVKENGTWQEKEFGCPAAIKTRVHGGSRPCRSTHCNIQEAFQDIHLVLGSTLSLAGSKLFECFYRGTG